jgi:hypothetical protein
VTTVYVNYPIFVRSPLVLAQRWGGEGIDQSILLTIGDRDKCLFHTLRHVSSHLLYLPLR